MQAMLDLETLSTKNNAAIIAIGAVAFTAERGVEPGDLLRFHRVIKVESNHEFDRHIDGQTVIWWMQQGEEARKVFADPDAQHLGTALSAFTAWIERTGIVEVWGNGSDFDNVILASAYEAARMRRPWSYNKSRCFRTAMADANDDERQRLWTKYDTGTHHNALDDALRQAHILCEHRWGVGS